MIRTHDMTGRLDQPETLGDLLDVSCLREQAIYYDAILKDLGESYRLDRHGKNRFKRASLALRYLADSVTANGKDTVEWELRDAGYLQ